ncbi:unnamed protein product, partial [Notodromas monacha]
MGHIQYFMSYSHLPTQFRDGANSGFHEAIGDTMSLSSSSMKHLQKIGLLKPGRFSSQEIAEKDINILLTKASSTFGQLGFAYSLDLWRWDVLGNDSVTNKNMNKAYWDHVERLMGIKPMPRTEEDLDPGAIYHVANGVSYIRYFMSIILQHQFHEAMCKAAGEYDPKKADKPLHNCDFYKSKPAGDLLRKAMHLGSSKPWPLVLEKITGQKTMTADSLKRFYKPLERFLDKFLAENKQCIGWGKVHQDNISKFYFRFNQAKFDMKASEPLEVEETAARNFFATWDLLQSNLYYPYASANWNYKTNMTEDNLNS